MISTIKMLVTDLDNTLLRTDRYISEHTIGALKACQAKGIKVVFATARSLPSASRFLAQFMPDIFVGYGGALVLEGDTVVRRFDIPSEVAAPLIRDCLASPEVTAVSAINESAALTSNRGVTLDRGSSHYKLVDFSEDENACRSFLKITINAGVPAAVERIAARYPMCDLMHYSGEDMYRFANREAVKWSAVRAVAEYFGISTDDVAAFGDDTNDLEMIENCGAGVAVANAIDTVKAAADCICASNDEDGVAGWIEENILKSAANTNLNKNSRKDIHNE